MTEGPPADLRFRLDRWWHRLPRGGFATCDHCGRRFVPPVHELLLIGDREWTSLCSYACVLAYVELKIHGRAPDPHGRPAVR